MKQIASGEQGTTLYMDDNAIIRVLPSQHYKRLLALTESLALNLKQRFIDTEFSDNNKVDDPSDFSAPIMIHPKIQFPTYPHEWCATMLKDGALFELDLAIELLEQNLFLKDIHLWNILFEHGKFKHVDVPSLIEFKNLPIEMNQNKSSIQESLDIWFHSMLLPYLIFPLLGYAYGKREFVHQKILSTTLNASTSIFQLKDVLPSPSYRLEHFARAFTASYKLISLKWLLRGDLSKNLPMKLKKIRKFIVDLPVSPGPSPYINYYDEKQENHTFDNFQLMNPKQQNVVKILEGKDIQTVLDVACNTGWFAKLSAHLGKNVIAFDIDEACIEKLYHEVIQQNLAITPIVASFLDLTPARYSINDGRKVLIEAESRLRSDCVLALGILHHLILGKGLELNKIIHQLSALTSKYLVLEYIELEDEKIKNHKDFFPAFSANDKVKASYDKEYIVQQLKKEFKQIWFAQSAPQTRQLIICSKEAL